jgi:hypothetical protein
VASRRSCSRACRRTEEGKARPLHRAARRRRGPARRGATGTLEAARAAPASGQRGRALARHGEDAREHGRWSGGWRRELVREAAGCLAGAFYSPRLRVREGLRSSLWTAAIIVGRATETRGMHPRRGQVRASGRFQKGSPSVGWARTCGLGDGRTGSARSRVVTRSLLTSRRESGGAPCSRHGADGRKEAGERGCRVSEAGAVRLVRAPAAPDGSRGPASGFASRRREKETAPHGKRTEKERWPSTSFPLAANGGKRLCLRLCDGRGRPSVASRRWQMGPSWRRPYGSMHGGASFVLVMEAGSGGLASASAARVRTCGRAGLLPLVGHGRQEEGERVGLRLCLWKRRRGTAACNGGGACGSRTR